MFWVLILPFLYPRCGSRRRIGSFRSNYGDGKKAIGLDWQNNNSPRESRFSVRFFAVVARLSRETF